MGFGDLDMTPIHCRNCTGETCPCKANFWELLGLPHRPSDMVSQMNIYQATEFMKVLHECGSVCNPPIWLLVLYDSSSRVHKQARTHFVKGVLVLKGFWYTGPSVLRIPCIKIKTKKHWKVNKMFRKKCFALLGTHSYDLLTSTGFWKPEMSSKLKQAVQRDNLLHSFGFLPQSYYIHTKTGHM